MDDNIFSDDEKTDKLSDILPVLLLVCLLMADKSTKANDICMAILTMNGQNRPPETLSTTLCLFGGQTETFTK